MHDCMQVLIAVWPIEELREFMVNRQTVVVDFKALIERPDEPLAWLDGIEPVLIPELAGYASAREVTTQELGWDNVKTSVFLTQCFWVQQRMTPEGLDVTPADKEQFDGIFAALKV